MDTLILNKDAYPLSMVPLSVISWQVAIRLISLGKVRVLKNYDDWFVRSPTITMPVPSIVICTEYVKWTKKVKYSRNNVYLRDDFTCQLQSTSRCKAAHGVTKLEELTLDHVIPRSKGGKTSWTNVVTSCQTCNSEKGNDYKIKPKKAPYMPSYYEIFAKRKKFPIRVRDPEWVHYLGDWDPTLIEIINSKQTNYGEPKDG